MESLALLHSVRALVLGEEEDARLPQLLNMAEQAGAALRASEV